MPVLTNRLIVNDVDAKMYSASHQIDTAQTAARIFIRENVDSLPYGRTIIRGPDFADTLEPYGLPLGYVPKQVLVEHWLCLGVKFQICKLPKWFVVLDFMHKKVKMD